MEAMSKNRLNPSTRAYTISMLIPDLKTSGNMKDKKPVGLLWKRICQGEKSILEHWGTIHQIYLPLRLYRETRMVQRAHDRL